MLSLSYECKWVARHIPIIHREIPSKLDLGEFPDLAQAQTENNFSIKTLTGPCQYGMHFIPRSNDRD